MRTFPEEPVDTFDAETPAEEIKAISEAVVNVLNAAGSNRADRETTGLALKVMRDMYNGSDNDPVAVYTGYPFTRH